MKALFASALVLGPLGTCAPLEAGCEDLHAPLGAAVVGAFIPVALGDRVLGGSLALVRLRCGARKLGVPRVCGAGTSQEGVRVDVVGVDGNRVAVEVVGSGRVGVVLLHGVTLSHRTWAWLVPSLVEAGATTYAVDQRGHGGSDRVPDGYSLAGFVGDAVAVVEAVARQHDRVVLVGHSLGGGVAACVAQQRPELLHGGVLEDPALLLADDLPVALPDVLRKTFALVRKGVPALQEAGVDQDTLAGMLRQVPTPFGVTAGERYHDDTMDAWAHGQLRLDASVLDRTLAGEPWPGDADQLDLDAGLRVPTAVVAADRGSADCLATADQEQRLLASSPELRWTRPAGAGHNLHDEHGHRDTLRDVVHGMLARVTA